VGKNANSTLDFRKSLNTKQLIDSKVGSFIKERLGSNKA
jgi:hypothetical protein